MLSLSSVEVSPKQYWKKIVYAIIKLPRVTTAFICNYNTTLLLEGHSEAIQRTSVFILEWIPHDIIRSRSCSEIMNSKEGKQFNLPPNIVINIEIDTIIANIRLLSQRN